MEMIKIQLSGPTEYRHTKTGELLHMVKEQHERICFTCDLKEYGLGPFSSEYDECDWCCEGCDEHKKPYSYTYIIERPAKWYKPENIKVVHLDPTSYYMPLYDL